MDSVNSSASHTPGDKSGPSMGKTKVQSDYPCLTKFCKGPPHGGLSTVLAPIPSALAYVQQPSRAGSLLFRYEPQPYLFQCCLILGTPAPLTQLTIRLVLFLPASGTPSEHLRST